MFSDGATISGQSPCTRFFALAWLSRENLNNVYQEDNMSVNLSAGDLALWLIAIAAWLIFLFGTNVL